MPQKSTLKIILKSLQEQVHKTVFKFMTRSFSFEASSPGTKARKRRPMQLKRCPFSTSQIFQEKHKTFLLHPR